MTFQKFFGIIVCMVIAGFNKLTLIDYPGKMACIVFFAGCNFRCPFCHNSAFVHQNEPCGNAISQEEIFAYLHKRKGVLEGVVISGGEPLLSDLSDFIPFIEKIKALGFKVKLDTNGSFPEKLNNILQKGLIDYVAMDIKNAPDKYSSTTGVNINLANINKSISIIKNNGIEYEFRTTLVNEFHNDSDLEKIALWLKNENNYFLQTFVNSGGLFNNNLNPADMDNALKIISKHVHNAKIR